MTLATKASRALDEEEAIRLFFARAEDLGCTLDKRESLDLVRRIVARVGCDRVGVQLAAARAKDLPLDALLRALDTLSEADVPEVERRVQLSRGEAMRNAGKLEDAARELLAVIEGATGDPHARAEAHRQLGSVYRSQGRAVDALAHKEAAVKLFSDLSDRARLALSEGEVGVALVALGRLRDARARHEKAVAAHRELGARREEGVELSYLGVTLHRLGLFAEAARAHDAALAIHRETGHRRLEGADLLHKGYVAHEMNKLAEASESFDDAAAILKEVSDRALLGVTLSYKGALAVEAERLEESGALFEQALALHTEAKSPRNEAMTWLHFSYHHTDLGEPFNAMSALERAYALGKDCVEAEHEAWILALLGRTQEAAAIAIEDSCTIHAIDLLGVRAALLEGTIGPSEAQARLVPKDAPGSRVRRASNMLRDALSLRSLTLEVASDGAWFSGEGGARIDLRRRTPLRKALVLLVQHRQDAPGDGIAWESILKAGWPGERVLADAGFARVRNALFQLRKLGIGKALVTGNSGYFLDPTIQIRVVPA